MLKIGAYTHFYRLFLPDFHLFKQFWRTFGNFISNYDLQKEIHILYNSCIWSAFYAPIL